jgi:GTPase SAR1 family protein
MLRMGVALRSNRVQWYPEISHYNPETPWLLVGTKLDTRDNAETLAALKSAGQEPITPEKVRVPCLCVLRRI